LGQSQEIVDYISERGFKNTYLFRNGVDFERFWDIPSYEGQNAKRKIVYAGLLGFAQGILNICQSIDFDRLGLEFHNYGAGTEKEPILNFNKEHPRRGIVYNGVVTREEIPVMLKQHD